MDIKDNTSSAEGAVRAKTARLRQDRVCEAMGIRTACLAILRVTRARKAVEEIFRLGRLADEVAKDNDGYLFSTFAEAAQPILDSEVVK